MNDDDDDARRQAAKEFFSGLFKAYDEVKGLARVNKKTNFVETVSWYKAQQWQLKMKARGRNGEMTGGLTHLQEHCTGDELKCIHEKMGMSWDQFADTWTIHRQHCARDKVYLPMFKEMKDAAKERLEKEIKEHLDVAVYIDLSNVLHGMVVEIFAVDKFVEALVGNRKVIHIGIHTGQHTLTTPQADEFEKALKSMFPACPSMVFNLQPMTANQQEGDVDVLMAAAIKLDFERLHNKRVCFIIATGDGGREKATEVGLPTFAKVVALLMVRDYFVEMVSWSCKTSSLYYHLQRDYPSIMKIIDLEDLKDKFLKREVCSDSNCRRNCPKAHYVSVNSFCPYGLCDTMRDFGYCYRDWTCQYKNKHPPTFHTSPPPGGVARSRILSADRITEINKLIAEYQEKPKVEYVESLGDKQRITNLEKEVEQLKNQFEQMRNAINNFAPQQQVAPVPSFNQTGPVYPTSTYSHQPAYSYVQPPASSFALPPTSSYTSLATYSQQPTYSTAYLQQSTSSYPKTPLK